MYYIPLIFLPIVCILSILRTIRHSPFTLLLTACIGMFLHYQNTISGAMNHLGFVLIYASLGAAFNYLNPDNLKTKKIIVTLSSLSFLVFLFNLGEILTSISSITELEFYSLYWRLPILAYSFSLFAWFFLFYHRNALPLLNHAGKNSLSIYFQHFLIYIYIYPLWARITLKHPELFYINLILLYLSVFLLPLIFSSSFKQFTLPSLNRQEAFLSLKILGIKQIIVSSLTRRQAR